MEKNTEVYFGFSYVYDLFMDNIPYDHWCHYLVTLLKRYGVDSGLVAELGCGTGAVTRRLQAYGYDMIGIDNSEQMLSVARERQQAFEGGSQEVLITDDQGDVFWDHKKEMPPILYLEQDMRAFELYGTVSAFVSVCDSMNYLLSEEDLEAVFRLVNNYLDPQGVFIFDLKTEAYFSGLADKTIAENREEASFIWNNFYDSKTKINQYDLTIYVNEDYLGEMSGDNRQREGEEEQEQGIFLRFDETHYQRVFDIETVKRVALRAGMEFVTALEAFTDKEPTASSERVYIILREKQQKQKWYQNKK